MPAIRQRWAALAALLALLFVAPQLAALQWSTHGPMGGPVTQIVVAPSAPRTLYACNGAGVFRSDDAGDTWRNVSGSLDGAQLIAVDPTNANIVFAISGQQIFRTTDGGASWRDVGSSLGYIRPSALLIDPNSPSTIYVGSRCGPIGFKTAPSETSSPFTGSGVLRSTDGGETWSWLYDGLAGRYFSTCIEELSLDPGTPQHLFSSPIYTDGGWSESYDSGSTWTRAAAFTPARAVVDDATLALTRYGITSVFSGTFLRTTDGGLSWTTVTTSGLPAVKYNDLALDPAAGRLFLATEGGVFRSGDGGTTWADAGAPRVPATHAVVDRAAGFVFASTSTGAYRAPTSLTSWQGLELNDAATHVLHVVADPQHPLRAYAVVFDYESIGRIFRTDDGGASWQLVRSGDGLGRAMLVVDAADEVYVLGSELAHYAPETGEWTTRTSPKFSYITADPHRPGVLFASSPYSPVISISTDGGATWQSRGGPEGYTNALVPDPARPSTLYAITNGGIAKSTDDGATWTTLVGGYAQFLAISPASSTRMYRTGLTTDPYGNYNTQALSRSDDGGATWTLLHPPIAPFVALSGIAVDPRDPESLWIVSGGRVIHTPDGGATWRDAEAPIDATSVVVASDGSRLHVATVGHAVWDAAIVVSHRRAVR